MRFMAMFKVSCASGLSAPRDMPGVTKRLRISLTLSTCSIGMAASRGCQSSRSRGEVGVSFDILATRPEYCLKVA